MHPHRKSLTAIAMPLNLPKALIATLSPSILEGRYVGARSSVSSERFMPPQSSITKGLPPSWETLKPTVRTSAALLCLHLLQQPHAEDETQAFSDKARLAPLRLGGLPTMTTDTNGACRRRIVSKPLKVQALLTNHGEVVRGPAPLYYSRTSDLSPHLPRGWLLRHQNHGVSDMKERCKR